jgi:uncharacterized protein (DUF1330 family)
MGSIEPSEAQMHELATQVPAEGPVVMINLLRYREQAAYPEGFDAEPCSGLEAYGRYGNVAMQTIASVGGRIVWAGVPLSTVIGPEAERWDAAVLVEYPSRDAFLEMLAQPKYQAAAPHRTAALSDSRVIATRPQGLPGSA